jgi:EmrB/QacA subfamily drug resistance transporter
MLFAAIGMAIGPTLGGYLTEYLSWHWIFFINVPVGIIAVILGLIFIPENKPDSCPRKKFDTQGAVLIFIGLASLLFTFSEGFVLGWTSPQIIISTILAVICIGVFIWWEQHYENPLIDLGMFKSKAFIIVNIVYSLLYFTFAGANYLLPFYLEYVHDFSTSNTGLILTSLSFGMMITGVLSGLIYAKLVGKIKYMVMVGVVFVGVGYFLLSHLSPITGLGVIITALSLIGLGLGITITPLTTLIMGAAPSSKQGMVSSLTGLERYAPMTIGVAVYNLIVIVGIAMVVKNSGIIYKSPADISTSTLSLGFDMAFVLSVILSIFILILCFFIKEEKAAEE